MPVSPLVTTAGAANANAYVSQAVADQYHLDRPAAGTTWSAATNDQKAAAILWATKLLDSLYDWTGHVVTSTQALLWPRVGMYYRSNYPVPSTIIPTELQHATAEFARQLLAANRTEDSEIETKGITALTAGPVSIRFEEGVTAKVVPDAVFHLLPEDWGTPSGREIGVRDVVRS